MGDRSTAVTPHGEVEYETVECSSCGTEVMKDDAEPFFIGDVRKESDRTYCYEIQFYNGQYRRGWACEHCSKPDNTAGFPFSDGPPIQIQLGDMVLGFLWFFVGLAAGIGLATA